MKLQLEQLSLPSKNASIQAYLLRAASLDFYWHHHPEYELTYIVKGRGNRLVGDNHQAFSEGDLVLIGPNLPHTWVGEASTFTAYEAIVIQFSSACIEAFVSLPESRSLQKLFSKAAQGLYFPGVIQRPIQLLIETMTKKEGIEAVSQLLLVLHVLSKRKSVSLASSYFQRAKGKTNERRVNLVFQYVQQQFKEKLTIDAAAALIHLSPSAFCKFFKQASGKTFSDYVNEIRIAHASVLLTETDLSITEIAYASGFESLTYFNRVFLKKKQQTPREFRKLTS